MRTSILNTATTEQMGYIIFSFFVYIKSTNQIFFLYFLKNRVRIKSYMFKYMMMLNLEVNK